MLAPVGDLLQVLVGDPEGILPFAVFGFPVRADRGSISIGIPIAILHLIEQDELLLLGCPVEGFPALSSYSLHGGFFLLWWFFSPQRPGECGVGFESTLPGEGVFIYAPPSVVHT